MILKEIAARRAVRAFRTDPVKDEQIAEIIKAGQFAPTSRDNRNVQFVVVKEPLLRRKLFDVVGQDFVRDAPVLLVPTTDPAATAAPIQDLSLATQNMMLQAVSMGLGTVWKNVRDPQAASVKELLGIPPENVIINIIPVGHPSKSPSSHTDKEFDAKRIRWDRY